MLCAALMASTAFAGPDYFGVLPPKVNGVPDVVKTVCSSCHGIDGNSIAPTFPDLAGQNYNYLLKELEDFRSGARKAAIMSQMITKIPQAPGNRNLKEIAAYFSEQQLKDSSGQEPKPSKALAEQGYRLYVQGLSRITPFLITKQEVPACGACHSANGMGNAPMAIPRLAGQRATYLETELQRFASGARHNGPNGIMAAIAAPLSATQIKAVAAYVSALDPGLIPGGGPKTFEAYVQGLKNEPIPGVKASALAGGGNH
jgi:cytochrome c553